MSPISNRLIVRTGPNPGMVFDLTKEITSLGRDVANDIVLGDPEVSRQHARITRTPGGYVVEDMGSTNGTFVNGERITAPRVLRDSDLVGLSEKVTLSFESVVPGSDETVVSQAEEPERYPPTVREPMPVPPESKPSTPPAMAKPSPRSATPTPKPVTPTPSPVQPVAPPTPIQQPVVEEEPRKRSPWLMAGCGCLVIIAVLIAVLWYMDANHPDILYAPLRLLGF
jgi:predicted component of type VI protein secretion system